MTDLGCDLQLVRNEAVPYRGRGTWYPHLFLMCLPRFFMCLVLFCVAFCGFLCFFSPRTALPAGALFGLLSPPFCFDVDVFALPCFFFLSERPLV